MKKNKGFTLIELLVSISILSILTIAFTTVSISAIKGNSKNSIDIVAMNIAQGEIENIKSKVNNSSSTSTISVNEDKFVTINDNKYRVIIEGKKAIEDEENTKLYEVKVTVTLVEGNKYSSEKLTTLVTQIRLNKI